MYEAKQAASKEAFKNNKEFRKLFGETAPLGIKLQTIKALRNGDCLFDSVCKVRLLRDRF